MEDKANKARMAKAEENKTKKGKNSKIKEQRI